MKDSSMLSHMLTVSWAVVEQVEEPEFITRSVYTPVLFVVSVGLFCELVAAPAGACQFYFFASARNCASPLSVSGCLSSAVIALSGQVATSAPILAHWMMCMGWRTLAARIWVSYP